MTYKKTALQGSIGIPPILIYPSLACAIGLTNSVCWQQLSYWINSDSNKNIFEGRKWVANTYEQWREYLPFWSKSTIERAFQEMEKMGIVLSRMERNVKYYSIDYDALETLLEIYDSIEKP